MIGKIQIVSNTDGKARLQGLEHAYMHVPQWNANYSGRFQFRKKGQSGGGFINLERLEDELSERKRVWCFFTSVSKADVAMKTKKFISGLAPSTHEICGKGGQYIPTTRRLNAFSRITPDSPVGKTIKGMANRLRPTPR